MTLSKETLEGISAHNAHRSEPCFNENWNKANKTGTMRARHLVMSALDFKHGICCGSMRTRKASKQDVIDYVLYRADSDLNAWSTLPEVVTLDGGDGETLSEFMRRA